MTRQKLSLLTVLVVFLLRSTSHAAQVQVGASATFTHVEKVLVEGQNLSIANATAVPLTYTLQSAAGEKAIIVE